MAYNQTHGSASLERLKQEDAVGQLRRRDGLMAQLGSENGSLKLDWVHGIERLLADDTRLEEVEEEARALWRQGIRHLIWAGMGGSIITVRVLEQMGFTGQPGSERQIAIYPLDSTDPSALNAIINRIAQAKGMSIPEHKAGQDAAWLHALLSDVMMVGVAMGMTSEEPITHLAWFAQLLERAELAAAEHLFVMTIPNSYLDQFARERNAPSRFLQLDGGNGTGGRMSAPTTRVFLLPAALYLTSLSDEPGQLRAMLQRAWQDYNLVSAESEPELHPFVQLAAACADASQAGACHAILSLSQDWQPLITWIEQLIEESLGKDGKGIVIFSAQQPAGWDTHPGGKIRIRVGQQAERGNDASAVPVLRLQQPYLNSATGVAKLAALATSFLGWQLSMALYGYLQNITFAGQPAVEDYKARARALKGMAHPLDVLQGWSARYEDEEALLFAPRSVEGESTPTGVFNALVNENRAKAGPERLWYLDLTLNGEFDDQSKHWLANKITTLSGEIGVPVKLRQAPADYHSTEQSEMDGPAGVLSLRVVSATHEACRVGEYSNTFLLAQAVSTWQAMNERGRDCCLLVIKSNA